MTNSINLEPDDAGYSNIASALCLDIIASAKKDRRNPVAAMLLNVVHIVSYLAAQQRFDLIAQLKTTIDK